MLICSLAVGLSGLGAVQGDVSAFLGWVQPMQQIAITAKGGASHWFTALGLVAACGMAIARADAAVLVALVMAVSPVWWPEYWCVVLIATLRVVTRHLIPRLPLAALALRR